MPTAGILGSLLKSAADGPIVKFLLHLSSWVWLSGIPAILQGTPDPRRNRRSAS